MSNSRSLGVEYFIKALCTGERTAAERLVSHLATDVEFDTNSQPGVPPIGRKPFTVVTQSSIECPVSGRRPRPSDGSVGRSRRMTATR